MMSLRRRKLLKPNSFRAGATAMLVISLRFVIYSATPAALVTVLVSLRWSASSAGSSPYAAFVLLL